MKLSVIIVNYNVRYFLEQALQAVREACRDIEAEVFVVDNNSVDDSVALVIEKFPEVILIDNHENVGFAIANNQAIEQAKGEYILLLNPDTVVEKDSFTKTVAFMDAHPEAGGLGVKMIDGKGNFLPESKRGFPTPWVAFSKSFGLSKLFPKSKTFNYYHLGYLDKDQTHEVEVLSGAFMMLRKTVLDKIGLLDETFFMYGEDIDLSWRIIKAGYKNYYFADTCIIHYKGESTKKGSLNYVRTFYQAMIIFARKHFAGNNARIFVAMLQTAVWLRATITLVSNIIRRLGLPMADAAVIYGGLYILKGLWANLRYHDPNYFQSHLLWFNFPLYIAVWVGAAWLSGGYDSRYAVRQLLRGFLAGSVINAAVYGFLGPEYRASRMLIIMGAVWAIFGTVILRLVLNFFKTGNIMLQPPQRHNLVIVGDEQESERVLGLLHKVQVEMNFIGTVTPESTTLNPSRSLQDGVLGPLHKLSEIVHFFKVNEIIFCSLNMPAHEIMQWMTRLGPNIDYKIVPEGSLSVIGSNSKNTSGDLYTIEIRFRIASPEAQRNKRVFDVFTALGALLLFPLLLPFAAAKGSYFSRAIKVLIGTHTWVGYHATGKDSLPRIKPGVYSPLDALQVKPDDEATIRRLNMLYAKDYSVGYDWQSFWRGLRRR